MDGVAGSVQSIVKAAGITPGIIAVVLVVLAIVLFTKPLKLIIKLLINTALGFAILVAINHFGAAYGIVIGVNWLNAIIVGIFGIPGVALLLVLKWLMLI